MAFRPITLPIAIALWLTWAGADIRAAPNCSNANALGVSRILEVDTTQSPHFGKFQFPISLPLSHHEVVLTFDDGPRGQSTRRVLAILAAECTRATFFMIGRNAQADPATARQVALSGHTVGHHSMTHPAPMTVIPPARAIADIAAGQAAIKKALGDRADNFASGFFRYPGLWNPPVVDQWLKENGIGVFGIDVHAKDWEVRDPSVLIDLAINRLEQAGSGMLLLHDIQPVTIAALPQLLITLKQRGWKVVHIMAKKSASGS